MPRRLIVVIDGLDQRSPEAAAAMLAAAHRLFGAGIVTLAAVAQPHLWAGLDDADPAGAAARFTRLVQIPYRIGLGDLSGAPQRALAAGLIGVAEGRAGSPVAVRPDVDAAQSLLERPWAKGEIDVLTALAPFAGGTPRAVKRFINLYRVARADPRLLGEAAPVFTTLALALAFDAHGRPEDLWALERASRGEEPDGSDNFREALSQARRASGDMAGLGQTQRALDVARTYTGRLD